jgi:hypothetical protein
MTAMPTTRQTRRLLWQAGLLAFAISVTITATAWSTPCDPTIFQPVPDCEPQQQKAVSYSFWESSYWDYYCTGDHPYFWGLQLGWPVNFTWDNSCFSVIENVFGEGPPNKFSGLFTNWCRAQDVVVTLGCSSQPPPGFEPSCNFVGGPVSDPKCPDDGPPTNHCAPGNFPVCFQNSNETCADGSRYFCTAVLGVVWCYKCG